MFHAIARAHVRVWAAVPKAGSPGASASAWVVVAKRAEAMESAFEMHRLELPWGSSVQLMKRPATKGPDDGDHTDRAGQDCRFWTRLRWPGGRQTAQEYHACRLDTLQFKPAVPIKGFNCALAQLKVKALGREHRQG